MEVTVLNLLARAHVNRALMRVQPPCQTPCRHPAYSGPARRAAQRDMLPRVCASYDDFEFKKAVFDLLARAHVDRGEVAEARAVLVEMRGARVTPDGLPDGKSFLKLGLQCAPPTDWGLPVGSTKCSVRAEAQAHSRLEGAFGGESQDARLGC